MKSPAFLFASLLFLMTACSSPVNDDLMSLLEAVDAANDNVNLSWDETTLYMESNSLPAHETGEFPNSGNPNTITAIEADYEIPLQPVYQEEAVDVKIFGVTLGGVVFDPGTAERDEATGWNIEALQDQFDLGLDFNNAHVQPSGKYHYHGIPSSLVEGADTLIGFAADGHPIFVNPDMTSSYQLLEGPRGEGEPAGKHDGTYTQDFEYVENSGSLDDCNGAQVVNNLYPEGSYAYFLTESFPYVPRCLHGVADDSFTQGDMGGPPPERSSHSHGGGQIHSHPQPDLYQELILDSRNEE